MFAGAAFTDQADIKVDADAVDTLVSLGIVEGFEDGSFQPNGTVTRAQMAKMIYVPVSYTHLDVYKRQQHRGVVVSLLIYMESTSTEYLKRLRN